MRYIAIVMVMGCLAAAPASGPTSAPESATATLLNGQLEVDVPPGWSYSRQSDDGKAALFTHDQSRANFMLQASPQASPVSQTARMRQTLGQQTVDKLTQAVVQMKGQTITAPQPEQDNRLFVRVRHKYRLQGIEVDQVLAYRALGRNLLMLSASAQDMPPDQAGALHDQAVTALLSVRPAGRGARPAAPGVRPADAAADAAEQAPPGKSTAFSRAGVRVTGPGGWQATENDKASGVIVTYRDPDNDSQIIMVGVRPLPEDMRGPANRQRVAEQMAAAEKAEFQMEGAEPVGRPEVVRDPAFLRKTRLDYEGDGLKFVVESRYVLVGDVLLSVISLAEEPEAPRVGDLADKVASDARALIR